MFLRSYFCGLQSVSEDILRCSSVLTEPARMEKSTKNECILQRLVPFLEERHSDGQYIFWPNLANSHYVRATLDLLESEDIPSRMCHALPTLLRSYNTAQ